MKRGNKTVSLIIATVLGLLFVPIAKAGPLEDMQKALALLQKARKTSAVQPKKEHLTKVKEILTVTTYDGQEDRAAALILTMQAIAGVNEFKLDKANRNIDMAIVKVKHAIQSIKKKTAAQKKGARKK
ncbi:MAG: hypothetical protein KA369_05440 [Spirochaetes bacterium]|nr:hypothetical protein [Spirochaetota bacterium]